MQFKVPQFLEIEDKIFGPFTFRQFVYLCGGGALCFVLYKLLGIFLGAIPILLVGGFSLALTFYRPNNKPFINMIEAGFRYAVQDKLFIWERRKYHTNNNIVLKTPEIKPRAEIGARLSGSKLKDLAWSLDILDSSKHEKALK